MNARRTSDSRSLVRALSLVPFPNLTTAAAHISSYADARARVNRSSSPARVLRCRVSSPIPRHASNTARLARVSHFLRVSRSSLLSSTARRHRLTARLASSRLARLPSASAHLPICVLDLVHISRHFAAVSLASRARVASRASHRLDSVSTARAHAVAASPTRRSSARNVARSVSSRIARSSTARARASSAPRDDARDG